MLLNDAVHAGRAVSVHVARRLRRVTRLLWKPSFRAWKYLRKDVEAARHLVRRGSRSVAGHVKGARRMLPGRTRSWDVGTGLASLLRYTAKGEASTCPACSSLRLSLLSPMPLNGRPRGERFGFVTGCKRCGLVFANPMPTTDALQAFYSPTGEWAQAREEEHDEKSPPTKYLLGLFSAVGHWIDVTSPPPRGRVLDFGSGGGDMLDFFAGYGWETFGIDPSDKRAFTRHAELPSVPDSAAFDVAVLHHVLEHVHNPLSVLEALHRALKPEGVLFVSVPRLDALPRHRDLRYCINARTHIVSFSSDSLRCLLSMAGFDAVEVHSSDGTERGDWYALRRLRVMARKVQVLPPAPRNPLNAARRALARYHAGGRADPVRWLPVRVRAALADRARTRQS